MTGAGYDVPGVASTSGLTGSSSLGGWLQSASSVLNPVSAGLNALGALAGPAGPSNAEAGTGPSTNTGWGTFNNPFIIASGGSTVRDVTTRQDGQVSLDQRPSGSVTNGGVTTAPLLEGGGSFLTLITIGVVAFLVVGVIQR